MRVMPWVFTTLKQSSSVKQKNRPFKYSRPNVPPLPWLIRGSESSRAFMVHLKELGWQGPKPPPTDAGGRQNLCWSVTKTHAPESEKPRSEIIRARFVNRGKKIPCFVPTHQ